MEKTVMDQFSLCAEVLDISALNLSMQNAECGGYVSFEGRVRAHNRGRQVAYLEYEAFEQLAASEFKKIARLAQEKYGVENICCVHRVGKLELGEVAVWIGVLSKHRQAAFSACAYLISELKAKVPIWKKEVYRTSESEWIADCDGCIKPAHDEIKFYQRQKRLSQVGDQGQDRLKNARILVVGAGGLGCPALQYLAGAGIGTIGVVDHDIIDVSNLHRQVLYSYESCGQLKAEVAVQKISLQNPFVNIKSYPMQLNADNAEEIIGGYDIILDCVDNFSTKFLLNDAAYLLRKTLVRASIFKFDGQLEIFVPDGQQACLRCLWPQIPDEDCVESCGEGGVIGASVGILGAWQAMEAIKYILGISVHRGLSLLSFIDNSVQLLKVEKNTGCRLCGDYPAIKFLKKAPLLKIEKREIRHG